MGPVIPIVTPAQRPTATKGKAQDKTTDDGFTVHSFQTLLADLGTIAPRLLFLLFTTRSGAPV